MDIKLPDISQVKRRNNISSVRNLIYEENKSKKGSISNLSTNNDNNSSNNKNNNNNNNSNNSNHSSTQNARHTAQDSKEPILPSIRTHHLDNVESDELLKAVLRRFSSLKQNDRHKFILDIFKDCDPADMTYIYKTLPTLHRDFLALLPHTIAYQIIVYTSPRDINTFAQVSKKWRKLITHTELWERLYDNIGLKSMYKAYLCKSITLNCVKLSLLTNWVKGKFNYNFIQAHNTGILQMCLFGNYLATAGADRTCKLYDIVTRTCLKVFKGHEKCILCIKMDGKKIITGSEDHTIRLWNIRTGDEIVKLEEHKGSVNSIAFYDTTLVSGSSDNTIKIWKMELIRTGNSKKNILMNKSTIDYNVVCLRTLFGHTASVQCVDILPTICVSGSSDGTIRLWHVESGNCIKIIYPTLLKSIPVYRMTPEITKMEDIIYEPISCIKLTYNYLVAGTYSGHIYLMDIYAKEITADDVFRPEWTNWKKDNYDIVNVENTNIDNFISSFNQQSNSLSGKSTKPDIIEDYSIPCNILTIRGREFAFEELIDWVNNPSSIRLNRIYNLDINAIPILPDQFSSDNLISTVNVEELDEAKHNNEIIDTIEKVNNDENTATIDNDKVNEKNNINVRSKSKSIYNIDALNEGLEETTEEANNKNNNNNNDNLKTKEETKVENDNKNIKEESKIDNNKMKNNKLPNENNNNNSEEKSKTVGLDNVNNLSMMDMEYFQNVPGLSNPQLYQSNELLSEEDDISVFERQFSYNSNSLFSKENSLEDIISPSVTPKKKDSTNISEKSMKSSLPLPKSIIDSRKSRNNDKRQSRKSSLTKKTLGVNNKSYSSNNSNNNNNNKNNNNNNKNTLRTGKYVSNKKKNKSKVNEKLSLDNYIYDNVDKLGEALNSINNNPLSESSTSIINNKNTEGDPSNDDTTNKSANDINSKSTKNNTKIEKYLKERYSNESKNIFNTKKLNNNNNNHRFKLDNGAAKWILGVQVDAWRLIAGGCEGKSIFWNHKIGVPLFEISRDTTNIETIPNMNAKRRRRKNQKIKYNLSNNYSKGSSISDNNPQGGLSLSENRSSISRNNNDDSNNNQQDYEFSNSNKNENYNDKSNSIKDKKVLNTEKIHSFVYKPGKDQPITDVIFNDKYIIISDIKGKLRIWEVHEFV